MIISKNTSCQVIDIWQPRWKDRVVLIATYKVGTHNLIRFSKAKSMEGDWYLSGETIKQCPKDYNGKIECYAVPISKLEPLERSEV